MRARHSPARIKTTHAKEKKLVTSVHIPLWTSCTFTFSIPRPRAVTCAHCIDKHEQPKHIRLLPQEMIDYIVDYLYDDARSLASCALASRAFAASSRYHLFGAFHIKDDRVLREVLDMSPVATSTKAIRTLTIGTTSILTNKPMLSISFASMQLLVSELPALSHLFMANISVEFSDDPLSVASPVPPSKAIDYLWLYKVISAKTYQPLSPSESFSIFRLFSAIETLNVSCGLERPTSPPVEHPADAIQLHDASSTPKLDVKSLKFCSSTYAVPFLRSVGRFATTQKMRAVEVCAQDRETLVALGDLLNDLRQTITELTIDCRNREAFHVLSDVNSMRQALNIPDNLRDASGLRTLRFKLHMSAEDGPLLNWHWQFVVGLMNDAVKTLPNVDHIIFLVSLSGYYPLKRLEAANWHTLEKALKQFQGLRRIQVGTGNSLPFGRGVMDRKKVNQALHDVFGNMLPAFKVKGLLSPVQE